MIYLFLLGLFSFITGAVVSYSPAIKESQFYYPAFFAITALSTLGWALLAKQIENPSRLLVIGLYWDTLMQLTYLLVPVLVFSARLSLYQSAGVFLIFTGLMMTRG